MVRNDWGVRTTLGNRIDMKQIRVTSARTGKTLHIMVAHIVCYFEEGEGARIDTPGPSGSYVVKETVAQITAKIG